MDIAERRKPQDGRSRLRFEGRRIDLRVSTLPTQFGEKVVVRLLNTATAARPMDQLDMSAENLRTIRGFLSRPRGMVLVTGPTGSGKTSTLYAALNAIKSPTNNIITLEDPIEFQVAGVNQTQINPRAGVTFASGLRSILRQDPNVILVGEIRDQETADHRAAGSADRAPAVEHASHQRRRVDDHAALRSRRSAVSRCVIACRRRGAAACPARVPGAARYRRPPTAEAVERIGKSRLPAGREMDGGNGAATNARVRA